MIDVGLLLQVLVALLGAGAVYGGIRSDLKAIHMRIEHNEREIERARDQLDRFRGCVAVKRDQA